MKKDILLINRHIPGINPLTCGEEMCSEGAVCGPITRHINMLYYVTAGRGEFICDGTSHSITCGQIFIIRPHEVVFYKADTHDPWHYIWVGFQSDIPLDNILNGHVICAPQCQQAFNDIQCCDSIVACKELYLSGKIHEVLSLIDIKTKKSTQEYMLKATNYLQSNFSSEINMQELSDSLGLNRSYFSIAFKQYTGKSPIQYLMDYRLEMGALLLKKHGYTIKQASLSSGHPDVCNFSRMFRRKFGTSPTGYIEQNAKTLELV